MRVAQVGGGFLGGAVATALGVETVVATRSGEWRHGTRPSHVRMLGMDITRPTLDCEGLRDCDHLFIAVAPGRSGQDRAAVYIDGTRRFLQRTAHIRWRRIVYIGSTSALPDRDAWLFEDEPQHPSSPRGRVQRMAEAHVLEHGRRLAIPTLVLRLGGLYGPGRDLGRLYRRQGPTPRAGDGGAPTNLVHLDDAVQASVAALRAPTHVGGVVHVCDDDHRTRRSMYDAIARAAGWAPVRWERPLDPGASPRGKRVSNLRMKLELGVRLQHPTHG